MIGSDNRKFSTYDRNNGETTVNCAVEFGAWWHGRCPGGTSLNGVLGSKAMWYDATADKLSVVDSVTMWLQ